MLQKGVIKINDWLAIIPPVSCINKQSYTKFLKVPVFFSLVEVKDLHPTGGKKKEVVSNTLAKKKLPLGPFHTNLVPFDRIAVAAQCTCKFRAG